MASPPKVQHVNKASSDELLQKFAELGSESRHKSSRMRELQIVKHKKRSRTDRKGEYCESPSRNGTSLVERRSLLPRGARRSALLRQLGIRGGGGGRGMSSQQLRSRDIKNKSFFGTIEKTWRKTVEGASKVFIERHYHRHQRLISDVV